VRPARVVNPCRNAAGITDERSSGNARPSSSSYGETITRGSSRARQRAQVGERALMSSGSSDENDTGLPVPGWTKPSVRACSACRPRRLKRPQRRLARRAP